MMAEVFFCANKLMYIFGPAKIGLFDKFGQTAQTVIQFNIGMGRVHELFGIEKLKPNVVHEIQHMNRIEWNQIYCEFHCQQSH